MADETKWQRLPWPKKVMFGTVVAFIGASMCALVAVILVLLFQFAFYGAAEADKIMMFFMRLVAGGGFISMVVIIAVGCVPISKSKTTP